MLIESLVSISVLTNSYWSMGSTRNVKGDNDNEHKIIIREIREMGDVGTKFPSA